MATYFLWGSIGLLVLVLVSGFLIGLGRGVKRASTHVLFVVVSIVISFFITQPVTRAVLNINLPLGEEVVPLNDYIIQMISENIVDLSNFDSASAFVQGLPTAIASPIIFLILMLLVYIVIDIIYLIVARISFGTKKKDFEKHKPHRLPGAFIGLVEAFLFIIILFAPITSLTHTYSELLSTSASVSATKINSNNEEQKEYLLPLGDMLGENMPPEVTEGIEGYNNSALGKICSLGGFDDAMFDGLSKFEIDGENICVRDEIVYVAKSYNAFAVFYNQAVIDKNFENLDFKTLKGAVTHVIENNLFKTVIANTIKDVVLKYDEIFNDPENPIELPAPAGDIIKALQTRFSAEDFDAYQYLSHDLKAMLEIVEDFVEDNGLGKITSVDTKDISSILQYATEENLLLSSSLTSIVDLNLVTDTLPILLEYANDQLEPNFANEQGLIVKINENISIEDLKATIKTLLEGENSIIYEVKELDTEYHVIDLISSEDIMNDILNTEGVSNALVDLGKIADKANNLPIFSFTEGDKEIKSLENLLILNGFDILDDKVGVRNEEGALVEEKTLDTFESVFVYIKEPIDIIIESGLVDLLNSEVDFNEVLDIIGTNISGTSENNYEKNYEFLAEILMPFYELDEITIQGSTVKAMVFDNVVNMLNESLSQYITLPDVETGDYETWHDCLVSVAELIDSLNSGEMTVAGQTEKQTYLEYMLSENADYFELIKTMNTDGAVQKLLNVIFGNEMYAPINGLLFETIDSQIEGITKVNPNTNFENLYTNKEKYINVITTIISNIDAILEFPNIDFADPDADLYTPFVAIGTILDTLKESAHEGVFKEIYVNLVWYVTGDVIDFDATYQDKVTGFEYAEKVKEFFGVEDVKNGYYEIEFGMQITDLVNFLKLGNQIVESLGKLDINNEQSRTEFVESIKTTLEEIENPVEVVETAVTLVNTVLDEDTKAQITENGEKIVGAIEEYITENEVSFEDESIKTALEALKDFFKPQGAESGV